MSTKIKALSTPAKDILLFLFIYGDQQATITAIAGGLNLPNNSVKSALKELQKAGLITDTYQPINNSGKDWANKSLVIQAGKESLNSTKVFDKNTNNIPNKQITGHCLGKKK